jgi:hypothetical protein
VQAPAARGLGDLAAVPANRSYERIGTSGAQQNVQQSVQQIKKLNHNTLMQLMNYFVWSASPLHYLKILSIFQSFCDNASLALPQAHRLCASNLSYRFHIRLT